LKGYVARIPPLPSSSQKNKGELSLIPHFNLACRPTQQKKRKEKRSLTLIAGM